MKTPNDEQLDHMVLYPECPNSDICNVWPETCDCSLGRPRYTKCGSDKRGAIERGYRANSDKRGTDDKTIIAINPELPPDFFCTPHEERSQKEIVTWWRIPFILTDECSSTETRYNVRRLDGGAWDRPTNYGVFDTLDEAIELAKGLLT